MHGIEVSPYAFDLAQMALWIGYLQWTRHNGYGFADSPLLRKMTTFQNRDAILDLANPDHPAEPDWPKVDFIIGNPPFLGGKILRRELGDAYVDKLFELYGKRLPNFSDLCCYWFEKARSQIEHEKCRRAGLLATQGIRGGANREVLRRIKASGEIFFSTSDREWFLDGANVHISMVGFCSKNENNRLRVLDGKPVENIHANLTAEADTTTAERLSGNRAIGYIGDVKAGAFDISDHLAKPLLAVPNPNGHPNSSIIVPWVNSLDVLRRPRNMWIIDFPDSMPQTEAAKFEIPYKILQDAVYPERSKVKRKRYREMWWIHAEPCNEMRARIRPLARYLVTPTISKYRIFTWMPSGVLPDHQLVAFARDDDYFFGILHSRFHEVWSLAQGTQLEDRPRYTPTTCFETFPFPEANAAQREAIASAARELDTLRERWLNPSEWTREEVLEFPATPGGLWEKFIESGNGNSETGEPLPSGDSSLSGLRSPSSGLAAYPRVVPRDADCAARLADRTLTKLYNQRPAWLAHAHATLDAAVAEAYGLPPDLPEPAILARLLARNLATQNQETKVAEPNARPAR
jgi:hypothetical protein